MNIFYSRLVIILLLSSTHLFSQEEVYHQMGSYFEKKIKKNIQNKEKNEIYPIPTQFIVKTRYSDGYVVNLTNDIDYLTSCLNTIMDLRKKELVGYTEGLPPLGAYSKELQGFAWESFDNVPKKLIENKKYTMKKGQFVMDEQITFEFKKRFYFDI